MYYVETVPHIESSFVSWTNLLSSLREEAVVVSPGLSVVYVNLPVINRTGLPSRRLIGQTCCRVLYDEAGTCDDHGDDCPVRMVLDTGKPASIVRRQTRAEGYRYYVEVTALPLTDASGVLVAVLCLPREVGVEERYSRIFDTTREGIAVISPSGRLVDVNPMLCEMLGYSKAEMAGKRVTDFLDRELAQSWMEPVPTQQYVEVPIPRKDGSTLYTEINVSSLRLGPVTLYVAFVRDISRRKEWKATVARQAEALADAAGRYQALFDSSGDVLVVLENDMTMAMVNRRFEEMTGYSRVEVEGRMSFLELVSEVDREQVKAIHRLRREEPAAAPSRHIKWILGKSGQRWLAEISGVIIPGGGRSLLDLRDTTEAHRLQEEVIKRHHELASLISVTSEMVSTLDLQTVLDRTLAIVCSQIGANHGLLCTFNDSKGELTATTFWGPGISRVTRTWKLGEGIVGSVAQRQEAIVWKDVRDDPRLIEAAPVGDSGHSVIAVPLKVRDKLLGVVVAISQDQERLSGDHLRVLTAYAAQASLALENALLYQEVKGQALTDQLTGLHNRRYFDARFTEELRRAERYGHELSLLFLDVNHLKLVNDRHGHRQGDILLHHVAELLVEVVRNTDIAVRFGGDEFVVVLPETSPVEATHVADRIIKEATPCPLLAGGAIPWGVSIGVSWVSTQTGYERNLLVAADEAAYRAKRDGTGWALAEMH